MAPDIVHGEFVGPRTSARATAPWSWPSTTDLARACSSSGAQFGHILLGIALAPKTLVNHYYRPHFAVAAAKTTMFEVAMTCLFQICVNYPICMLHLRPVSFVNGNFGISITDSTLPRVSQERLSILTFTGQFRWQRHTRNFQSRLFRSFVSDPNNKTT